MKSLSRYFFAHKYFKQFILLFFITWVTPIFAIPLAPAFIQQNSFPPSNVAEVLGWVPLHNCANICCGYYRDPLAAFETLPLPPLATTQVQFSADQSKIMPSGTSVLLGNVIGVEPGRILSSDQIYLTRDPRTNQMSSADLVGHVTLREPDRLVVADRAHMDLATKAGIFFHVVYHFMFGGPNPCERSALYGQTAPMIKPGMKLLQPPINAWGIACSVERLANKIIILKKTTYSTCEPVTPFWKLFASTVILDPNTGRGKAYNTWLDIKNIPVFYTPYFSFPIDHRRKSGFLFPTIGHNSRSGTAFGLPFYWNIAPNYDATITPTWYSKRGLFTNGIFRYLTPISSGNVSGGFLPNDRVFQSFKESAPQNYPGNPALNRLENSSNNRGYVSWQDITNFNNHWSGGVNYNWVSDDYFLEDFNALRPITPNQLPQQANLNYTDDIWTFKSMVRAFQTLHPVNQAIVTNAYQSLPEIDLNANLPDQAFGLDYKIMNQFVYFQRQNNPGEIITPMNAGRANIQPSVSLPITGMPGYFTPTAQLVFTQYNIGNQLEGYPNSIQRVLPIFDIDTGLYFDRNMHLFNCDYEQTLEPRLFYLYVPYRNQNNIPIFDSAIAPFSYQSMFLTNRFSGYDRIGDANQITLALTTRILNDVTGAEKFRASLGEILYFRNRGVPAGPPQGTPGAISSGTFLFNPNNPVGIIGATSPTERTSPFAGLLSYSMTPNWNVSANGVWDPHTRQAINGALNLQYLPSPHHVFNINYNYIRYGDPQIYTPPAPPIPVFSHQNDLNQAGFSFAWPIRGHWQAVGGLNYDVIHHYPQSYLYGLEYDTCCWAARFVAGRAFVGLNQNNNPVFDHEIYFQWQFKGLGNLGTGDPAGLLVNNIPGYQDTFDNFTVFQ